MFAGLYIACKEICHRTNVFFWNGTTATQKWGSEANPEYQCSMSEGSQSCSAPKPGRKRDDMGRQPCRVKTAETFHSSLTYLNHDTSRYIHYVSIIILI